MDDRLRPFGHPPDERCSDKVVQGYLPDYLVIASVIGPKARVLELGVDTGASLRLWMQLFPLGEVVGVDRNGLERERVPSGCHVVKCDQADPMLPRLASPGGHGWDLIIDDASHDARLTWQSFHMLWPLVKPGGFYVIEDWYANQEMQDAVASLLPLLDYRGRGDDYAEEVSYRYGLAIVRKGTT